MVRPTADNRTYLTLTNILTQIRYCGWTSDTLGMLGVTMSKGSPKKKICMAKMMIEICRFQFQKKGYNER